MDSTKQPFPELVELKLKLERRVELLNEQLAEARKQLESVATTDALLQRQDHYVSLTDVTLRSLNSISPNELQGLTQLQALVKIAKANNNRFKLSIAKDLLLRAGVTKSPKNANNIIFNVIKRSERFKWVAHGEYELLSDGQLPFRAVNVHAKAV